MYKKRFFFIVFEGTEGTGKSFQINKLFISLKKKKFKVIKTREPGGCKSAEKIRNLIFNNQLKLDDLTDYYLMLASRNEHLKKIIIPAKKNKSIIISDRFVDSTVAYQVVEKKIDKKLNDINEKYILKKIKPNLTIVLKSNYTQISKRLNKRKKSNKFDKLKKTFLLNVQNTFIKIAKKNTKNYVVLDSSGNNDKLEKKILSIILKKLSS
jgi:dTMP kinase